MTLANTTSELLKVGVLTPKDVGVILSKLQYLFVHMLVYNKQFILSFSYKD